MSLARSWLPLEAEPRAIQRVGCRDGCLLTLAVLVIFLASSVPDEKTFSANADLFSYFIPQADRVGRALAEGRIPWWNPEVACGVDQFATLQSAVYYPPTWVYAVLPVPAALAMLVFGHLLLAGMGMYRWLTAIGVQWFGALLGATTLAFGMVGESWWPPILYTLSWTPWILYAVDARDRSSLARWTLAVTYLSLQLLAGFPEICYYGLMFLFPYVVIKAIHKRSWPLVVVAISVPLMAGLVSAAQLLPSYRLVQQIGRVEQMSPEQVHYLDGEGWDARNHLSYATVRRTAKSLLRMLGNPTSPLPHCLSYRQSFGYLGALAPIAAAVALWSAFSWRTCFFAVISCGGIYLSQGYMADTVPLYDLLARVLPVFGSFRTPDRLLVWMLFGVAALVAIGAQHIWPEPGGRPVPRRVLAGIVLFAAVARMCWWWRYGGDRELTVWTTVLLLSIGPVLLGKAATLGGGRKASSGSPRPRCKHAAEHVSATPTACENLALLRIFPPAAVAYLLLLVDICFASGYVLRFFEYPGDRFRQIQSADGVLLDASELESIARLAGKDRIYITPQYRPILRTALLPEFKSLPFYEPMAPASHSEVDSALAADRDPRYTYFGYWGVPAVPHRRWHDWCSIRVLVTRNPIPHAEQHGWREMELGLKTSHAYRNLHCVPRAALFQSFRATDRRTALARLCEPRPVLAADLPCLETGPRQMAGGHQQHATAQPGLFIGESGRTGISPVLPKHRLEACATAYMNNPGQAKGEPRPPGETRWILDEPEHIVLEADCRKPAILVLSDTFFPGWRCTVNGQEKEILRANLLHRAVPLEAGQNRVEFRYRPAGTLGGVSLSILGLAGLAAAAGVICFRSRQRRSLGLGADPRSTPSAVSTTPDDAGPRAERNSMRAGFDYDRIEEGYYDLVFRRNQGIQSKWHHLNFAFIQGKIGTYQSHLDIGCGPGTLIGLLDPGLASLGLDISKPQINYARSRYASGEHQFRCIDAGPLLLEDNSFDVVTVIQLIEHLTREECRSLLSEAYRVLRPGGRVILSTPNYRSLWPVVEALLNRLGKLSYKNQHITHLNHSKLTEWMEEAGFVDLSVEAYLLTAPFCAAIDWRLSDLVAKCEPAWVVKRFALMLLGIGHKPAVVPDKA